MRRKNKMIRDGIRRRIQLKSSRLAGGYQLSRALLSDWWWGRHRI